MKTFIMTIFLLLVVGGGMAADKPSEKEPAKTAGDRCPGPLETTPPTGPIAVSG